MAPMIDRERTLIAGGTGLIGTNLTHFLLNKGVDVISTYFSSKPPFAPAKYKRYDFTNFQDCIEATRNVHNVFICAAQNYVKAKDTSPTGYLLPDLAIYAGLFEACYRNRVQKVIFLSSSTVYQGKMAPIAEHELDLNQSPFESYFAIGWLYRYIEKMAQFYSNKCGLQTGIVRLSYVYGPWDTLDSEKMHVIPGLIKRALHKEVPYKVWGDGDAVRDCLFVHDLVQDLMDILNRYCLGIPMNIGTGKETTVREIVEVVLKTCDHNIAPEYEADKNTGIPYRVMDVSKCLSVLGERKRTSLDEGIRKTVDWYRSRI